MLYILSETSPETILLTVKLLLDELNCTRETDKTKK